MYASNELFKIEEILFCHRKKMLEKKYFLRYFLVLFFFFFSFIFSRSHNKRSSRMIKISNHVVE